MHNPWVQSGLRHVSDGKAEGGTAMLDRWVDSGRAIHPVSMEEHCSEGEDPKARSYEHFGGLEKYKVEMVWREKSPFIRHEEVLVWQILCLPGISRLRAGDGKNQYSKTCVFKMERRLVVGNLLFLCYCF